MDALQHVAHTTFSKCNFYGEPLSYATFAASKGPDPWGIEATKETTSSISHLARSEASFVLVKIEYQPNVDRHGFHANKGDCESIGEAFKINPSTLGMIANDMSGYHRFGQDAAGACTSYYLQCAAYKFIWSYDLKRQCTRAIAFVNNSKIGHPAFQNLMDVFQVNTALVCHPLFLPLSAATQTFTHMMSLMRGHYDTCLLVELATGYRPLEFQENRPLAHMEKLSEMSRSMSILARETEMASRRIKQWKMAIVDWSSSSSHESLSVEDNRLLVSDTLGVLKSKIEVMEVDFAYIGERARIQLVAISQIMTQDDALASIRLARATARDSSSMKVVAIMTMAFLPGTFFAALFAIPSLTAEGEGDTEVRGNFWVYWAFTLPCTFMVFVVWAALTQRRQIRELLGIR